MFCSNCGASLIEGARFCASCGTAVTDVKAEENKAAAGAETGASTEGSTGTVTGGETQKTVSPGGKKKTVKLAILAAVLVVVLAAAGVLVFAGGALKGPKAKVGVAILKTASAYQDAWEKAGLVYDVSALEENKYSQNLSVTVTDVGKLGYVNLSAMEGAGVRMKTDMNLPGKEMSFSTGVFYGETDLASAKIDIDDNKVYVSSPEILGTDKYYGADTRTLGKDLVRLGADEQAECVGFTVYEIIDVVEKYLSGSKENEQLLKDAQKALLEAITVEKNGKESVKVNGTSVDCNAYQVIIPQRAMEKYLDAVLGALDKVDYVGMTRELLTTVGLPDDVVEDLMGELQYEVQYYEEDLEYAKDDFEDTLDFIGDLELQVYVKGNYVMAVRYSEKIDDMKLKADLMLGGGKNYVDDLSLKLSLESPYDEYAVVLTSNGDHGASSGAFTDETRFVVKEDNRTYFEAVSKMRYAAKEKADNFTWSVEAEEIFEVEAEGNLAISGSNLTLDLDELSLRAAGSKIGAVGLFYEVGPYNGKIKPVNPVMLSTLDEDSLEDMEEEILENAEEWMGEMMDFIGDEFSEDLLDELMWLLF